MAKLRSPNYPATPLPEAIVRVERLFRAVRKVALPEEDAAREIGYKGLTGPSRTVLSAMKKYGLLEETAGGVKVSALAERILHPSTPREKETAIHEAALRPELFRELAQDWLGASPTAIESFLIRGGFSDDGARTALKAFQVTADFANLADDGDYSVTVEAPEEHPMTQALVPAERGASGQPSAMLALPSGGGLVYPIFIEQGRGGTLAVPSDVTEDDLDRVVDFIEFLRAGLKRKAKAAPTEPTQDQ